MPVRKTSSHDLNLPSFSVAQLRNTVSFEHFFLQRKIRLKLEKIHPTDSSILQTDPSYIPNLTCISSILQYQENVMIRGTLVDTHRIPGRDGRKENHFSWLCLLKWT